MGYLAEALPRWWATVGLKLYIYRTNRYANISPLCSHFHFPSPFLQKLHIFFEGGERESANGRDKAVKIQEGLCVLWEQFGQEIKLPRGRCWVGQRTGKSSPKPPSKTSTNFQHFNFTEKSFRETPKNGSFAKPHFACFWCKFDALCLWFEELLKMLSGSFISVVSILGILRNESSATWLDDLSLSLSLSLSLY